MPNQPEYVAALQNAASAYMQGLQNREAREQRERERAQEVEQQRKNFLLNFQARQAEAGNVGAARQLDTEFGLTPQVPAGFSALLPKPNQVTNPQALNDAQRKLIGAVSSVQGMPAPESPHFYQEHAAFSPNESQALQQGQQAFEQQNLAGLTGLSQGKSSPAFQGAFEQFAQQQQVKQQQALEQRQAETKRAQDEKYFEDVDRAVLDGRVSPADATKYFQAKRDYVSGKTTELPTVDLREKPTGGSDTSESRAERERNRRTATLLTALSRSDNAIQAVNDGIKQEYDAWNKFSSENTDPRLLDARSNAFIKRTKELENKRSELEKRQNDFNKMLESLMVEEGLPAVGFAEAPKVDEQKKQRVQQAAMQIYQTLLKAGQPMDYARSEAVRRFGFDPLSGQFLDESKFQGESQPVAIPPPAVATPEAVATQALQATDRQGLQTAVPREDRAKAFLESYRDAEHPNGFESDETSVKLFLQNNPNF